MPATESNEQHSAMQIRLTKKAARLTDRHAFTLMTDAIGDPAAARLRAARRGIIGKCAVSGRGIAITHARAR